VYYIGYIYCNKNDQFAYETEESSDTFPASVEAKILNIAILTPEKNNIKIWRTTQIPRIIRSFSNTTQK
jgi:hypothetical protein